MEYLTVLFWATIGSVFSLIGGILLLKVAKMHRQVVRFALPIGAGALLAAAFLGIIPEAVEGSDIHQAVLFALIGFLAFFLLERLLGWFHHHEDHHHDEVHGKRDVTHRWLVVIGDTLHNVIDGVAIGAAFLVNPATGIGTALAVAAHEVPQEIGDFGILLGKGMQPRNVIIVNIFSALATVVTAVGTFALGLATDLNPAPFLAIAAGMFIYTAASDLIPDIHERPKREGNIQAAMLLIGVLVIGLVTMARPHSHEHGEVHHEESAHVHDEHDHHD